VSPAADNTCKKFLETIGCVNRKVNLSFIFKCEFWWLFALTTTIIISTDTLAEGREKRQEQLLILLSFQLGKHEIGGASHRERGE